MDRQEIMEILAEWFNVQPNENDEFNINDYDFQAGCYLNGKWLCLAEIVECIEANM